MTIPDVERVCIRSGDTDLAGAFHLPAGRVLGGIVMCNPVFEERKCAARMMYESAESFCDAGLCVLRFDYRGCGDSGGSMRDFGPEHWVGDILAASESLRGRVGLDTVGLLGLRVGAALALVAARNGMCAGPLVLWEPVIGGKAYMDRELQRKLVREMAVFGKSRARRSSLAKDIAEQRSIDFDGYEVSPGLYNGLGNLDMLNVPGRPACTESLIIQVTHRNTPHGPVVGLADSLRRDGVSVETYAVIEEPFWNRIGHVDCSLLMDCTRDWLARRPEYRTDSAV